MVKTTKAEIATFVGVLLVALTFLVFPFVNPCETEDAALCTWNALDHGNGIGSTFTNFYGIIIYHP